mmetsp:Transcript_41477/g.87061  ORF Transcript_41477/g.87061 Transcript_41477/m.87061 type:complete len:331 (+) Transcript_41477:270-1262(+)
MDTKAGGRSVSSATFHLLSSLGPYINLEEGEEEDEDDDDWLRSKTASLNSFTKPRTTPIKLVTTASSDTIATDDWSSGAKCNVSKHSTVVVAAATSAATSPGPSMSPSTLAEDSSSVPTTLDATAPTSPMPMVVRPAAPTMASAAPPAFPPNTFPSITAFHVRYTTNANVDPTTMALVILSLSPSRSYTTRGTTPWYVHPMNSRGKALRTTSGCWFCDATNAPRSAVGSPTKMAATKASSVRGNKTLVMAFWTVLNLAAAERKVPMRVAKSARARNWLSMEERDADSPSIMGDDESSAELMSVLGKTELASTRAKGPAVVPPAASNILIS